MASGSSVIPTYLAGGGEMGDRIRSHDWSRTPLGDPNEWPLALRTALGICLHSSFPTAIYWGSDLHLLYNDAWAPIPADRHPWALGRPGAQVWADIWAIVGPQLEKVMATGEGFSAFNQMLPMERDGVPQETYWTYSFTPIRDENGVVAGVLNQGHEMTAQIVAERALRESQERLELALSASNSVGTWDWDIANDRVTADERFAHIYGVDPEQAARGAPITDFFSGIHPGDIGSVQGRIAEILKTGELFSEEYRLVQPDGSIRWVAARGRAVLDEQGKAIRFPGVTFDITQRRLAEETIREAKERRDFIFSLSERLRASSDSDTILSTAAEALGRQLGIDRAGFYRTEGDAMVFGPGWSAGRLPVRKGRTDSARYGDYYNRTIRSGKTMWFEDSLADQNLAMTDFAKFGIRAAIGVPVVRDGIWLSGLYINHQDPHAWSAEDIALAEEVAELTWDAVARAEAADALRQSEEKFRGIANSINQMIWSTQPDGYHDYYNDRWYEYTGVPYGSTDGAGWNDMFHPDDQERAWGVWRECLETGEPYHIEYRLRHRSGDYRWVLGRAQPVRDAHGAITRWFGTCTDIHELKVAEDRQAFLLELNDILRGVSDPRAGTMAAAEALGRHLRVARAGYGDVDASGEIVRVERDWTARDDVPNLAGEARILDGFGPAIVAELRAGHSLVVDDFRTDPRAGPAYAETWDSIGCRALIVVPLVSEGQLRALFYLHEPEPRAWTADDVTLANDVAQRTWDAVERARAQQALRQLNATLEERVLERTAELERTQAALRQSQKMEAIGQLTGGIAHDFNNMLAVVIGGLNLLQRRLAKGETDVAKYIDASMEGATRAASLTQRLLAFSRQQPLQPEPINANRMVAGMTELLTRTLGEDVRVETVLSAGLWKANADLGQLENAVLNLSVNARDAMPGGGKLTIETGNAHIDDDYARDYEIQSGQYVMIAVSDTGSGMPPDVIEKAFDPFFTTKSVGKGTGLGLSQVFGFVRQSGGHVKIYSEVGVGTTVKIYLPRFYGPEPQVQPKVVEAPRGGSLSEVILVVEDEERVRNYSIEALRELGYTVVHAPSGPDALRLIDAGQGATLLFTDVVMPEMTGRQLADEAVKRIPGLKVLYTTGYTRNAVVHNGVLDPGTNFLPKPFGIDQLAAKVRSVLDE
ncbi:PAS domain-containing protein [Allosphingosinicella vermicomposti]|uniref:PAS domain-containing protein n=1 Tax=Allosphingosinicella vermicomposti TaxID=614671 RepID=UPI000D10B136|nr:PAS domain-containing protein [Allosphingosinicella vermicomposti]